MKKLIVLFSLVSLAYCQQKYRLCVFTTEGKRECDLLNKAGQEVMCVVATDSIDCTRQMKNQEVDLTVLFPEQAHLASSDPYVYNNWVVVGEIRAQKKESQPNNLQMVVVVKKEHSGGLEGLRGKKYCHPGFDGHDLWSPRLLKEFEYKLFGTKYTKPCDSKENITYIEHELKVLDEFFGESCRNGPWSDDSELNDQLAQKYSKLTSLCTDNVKRDSLSCLKVQQADVAYTTMSEALTMPDKDNYRLLCQNGSLVPIRNIPLGKCSWRNQPWPLVLGARDKAQQLQSKLRLWIKYEYHAAPGATPFGVVRGSRPDWVDTLATILLQDLNQYRINVLEDQPLILDYFKRNNQQLDSYIQSDCRVKWCTVSSKEQEKCVWLEKASAYAGIVPEWACKPAYHLYDCLRQIRENIADFMVIDSNYGYLARKMGLSNLLYSENSADDIASVIAVIPENSGIKSFSDIKNKRACFPEYRGLAWVSFIDSARRLKLMKNNCKFDKNVGDFFNQVCAPGATDEHHYRNDSSKHSEVYEKLCSACSENCKSDVTNRYFNNTGVLRCLEDNKADVVFTEWQTIEKLPNLSNYRIVCRDGDKKVMTIDEYRQNTDACSLSNTVDSEVVARHNDTRRLDYKHALLEMDILFGSQYRNDKTFEMFKPYDGIKDLLFKDNVLGLADKQTDNQYVQNYVKLFESVDKCTNNASFVKLSTITLLLSFLFVFFNRQM